MKAGTTGQAALRARAGWQCMGAGLGHIGCGIMALLP